MSESIQDTKYYVGSSKFSVAHCGVFLLDCNTIQTSTINAGSIICPIVCSFNNLSKLNMALKCDLVVVYPGFRADVYKAITYSTLDVSVDNTNSDNISVKRLTDNTARSIRVYYKGSEIFLNSLSDGNGATFADTF
jgi:hypothetical protein